MMNETLGKWHFWLFVIGFHLTFDFMHIPGILGMPRRIYTYEAGRGWGIWNLIVSSGVSFRPSPSAASSSILCGPIAGAKWPGRIRGTHGRSNGPRPLRRRSITSPAFQPCKAGVPCGT